MRQPRTAGEDKIQRITSTAERLAHQMGGTFVEVRSKRADFEVREQRLSGSRSTA